MLINRTEAETVRQVSQQYARQSGDKKIRIRKRKHKQAREKDKRKRTERFEYYKESNKNKSVFIYCSIKEHQWSAVYSVAPSPSNTFDLLQKVNHLREVR